jgi:hypothetical protein
MKEISPKDANGTISPSVHLEFIQNQASVAEPKGIEEVEAYHRALFLHHHAREIELYQQQGRIHQDRLAHLESRLKDIHAKLAGVEKLAPVSVNGDIDVKPTAPWNWWDRSMFLVAGLGILGLLVFGVLNISFNLLESGLVTFVENPIRSYFWAALLPIGALGVKVGWDFLHPGRRRDFYLWMCLTAGIAGVLVWMFAYSTVYPTLSKTTAEHLASLSVFDQAQDQQGFLRGTTFGGAKVIDAIIVAAQAIAEIFLSATLGIYMTIIYGRHRPVRLANNPIFTQLDEERRNIDAEVARERIAFGEARGNQTRLENQLSALLAFARSLFHKESALRQDQSQQKRILLDQISDELRSRLQTFENGSTRNSIAANGK